MRLNREFFSRSTLEVAKDLLGKELVYKGKRGRITEVEAYTMDEESCHAFGGVTPRSKVMYGPPGVSYVYFIYGMYHCLNFVTEEEGRGCAVLIRGVEPIEGLKGNTDGPGKLCRAFGIDKKDNGIDICSSDDFYIEDKRMQFEYQQTKRIGIKKAADLPWRFVVQ